MIKTVNRKRKKCSTSSSNSNNISKRRKLNENNINIISNIKIFGSENVNDTIIYVYKNSICSNSNFKYKYNSKNKGTLELYYNDNNTEFDAINLNYNNNNNITTTNTGKEEEEITEDTLQYPKRGICIKGIFKIRCKNISISNIIVSKYCTLIFNCIDTINKELINIESNNYSKILFNKNKNNNCNNLNLKLKCRGSSKINFGHIKFISATIIATNKSSICKLHVCDKLNIKKLSKNTCVDICTEIGTKKVIPSNMDQNKINICETKEEQSNINTTTDNLQLSETEIDVMLNLLIYSDMYGLNFNNLLSDLLLENQISEAQYNEYIKINSDIILQEDQTISPHQSPVIPQHQQHPNQHLHTVIQSHNITNTSTHTDIIHQIPNFNLGSFNLFLNIINSQYEPTLLNNNNNNNNNAPINNHHHPITPSRRAASRQLNSDARQSYMLDPFRLNTNNLQHTSTTHHHMNLYSNNYSNQPYIFPFQNNLTSDGYNARSAFYHQYNFNDNNINTHPQYMDEVEYNPILAKNYVPLKGKDEDKKLRAKMKKKSPNGKIDDDKLCITCVDYPRTVISGDCKHKIMCVKCANKLMKKSAPMCPVCRGPINFVRDNTL